MTSSLQNFGILHGGRSFGRCIIMLLLLVTPAHGLGGILAFTVLARSMAEETAKHTTIKLVSRESYTRCSRLSSTLCPHRGNEYLLASPRSFKLHVPSRDFPASHTHLLGSGISMRC